MNEDTGKISVIVTAYNVGQFLEKCIKSLSNQSYKNIEIIIVNDGSTDDGIETAGRLAVLDSRIKILNKKNGGVSSARNAGLDSASGSYFAFVDGDDRVEPDYCKVLLELMIKHNAGVSCCGLRSQGMTGANYNPAERPGSSADDECVYTNIQALERVPFMNCGKLFLKELFQGIRYPEGRNYDDEFVIYRLIHRADRTACTARQLYNRNLRQGSLTRSGFSEKKLDIFEAFRERADYYQANGLNFLKVKTIAGIAGIAARLKIEARKAGAGPEILEKIEAEYQNALKMIDAFKGVPVRLRIKVLAYRFIPGVVMMFSRLRDRLFIKKIKN